MKVAVLVPGGVFTPGHYDSMVRLSFKLGMLAKEGWEVVFRSLYCPVVHHGRNRLLLAPGEDPQEDSDILGGWEYDKILWLETDMVFNPEDVLQLLEDDGDVVSGIYPMGPDHPDVAVAGNLPEQRLLISRLHGHKQDLIEVDFCGLGMVAVRRGVFESLKYPWFHTLYSGYNYVGDDFGWCAEVKERGFRIYVDRRVRAGHQKQVVV